MVTVDSKGRVLLPKEIRERLGLRPGTEVEIREEDRRAVVEPEEKPEDIIARMEDLVEATSGTKEATEQLADAEDPIARKHRHAVRRGADRSDEG